PFILPSIGTVFDNTAFGQNSNVHIANNCNSSIAANGGQCTVGVSAGTLDGSEKGSSAIMQFSLDNDSVGQRGVVLDNIIEVMADSTQRTGAYEKLQVIYTGSSTTGVPINSVAIANPQYLEVTAPFGATPADNCTGETLTSLEPTCTIWLHAIKQNSPQVHNTTVTVHYSPSIGENDSVSATVKTSTLLYAVGNFTLLGDGTIARRVAAWNGTTWLPVGSGVANGFVWPITIGPYGNVYVGGSFTQLGNNSSALNIAMWNGNQWQALDNGSTLGNDGLNGIVYAATTDNDGNIFFGGDFTQFEDGSTAFRIAEWHPNTQTWSTPGIGFGNGFVDAIRADSNNQIYAGGSFTRFGNGSLVNRIARWNPNTTLWSPLNDGTNNGFGNRFVTDFAIDSNNNVYTGGSFTLFGSSNSLINRIALWNSTTPAWSPLNDGTNNGFAFGLVERLAIDSNGNIYAVGNFTRFGSSFAVVNRVAKWDGSNWDSLIDNTNNRNGIANGIIYGTAVDGDDNLYVSGLFTQFGGGNNVNRVAKWDSTNSLWSVLPVGNSNGIINGVVYSLAIGSAIEIQ
ncbi:MAG: hypothetical protein AAGA27_06720, partial [Pseudomonadota bacterium]